MYCKKSILMLSVLMHISILCSAQQFHADSVKQGNTERKWSFSFTMGAILIGPGAALEREMAEIGFGDEPGDLDFFGLFTIKNNQEYPQAKTKMTWDMEARLNLSAKSSVGISFGKSLHATASGYRQGGYTTFDGSGYDYYLTIVHDVWFVSADYIFRFDEGHGGFSVGPVMAMHRVSEGSSSSEVNWTTTVKPGLHVGCDIPLFQKKSWFMSFGMNYTWLPPTEIGPNAEKFRTTSGGGFPGVHTSGNQRNSIPLATFQLGLTTGWRF